MCNHSTANAIQHPKHDTRFHIDNHCPASLQIVGFHHLGDRLFPSVGTLHEREDAEALTLCRFRPFGNAVHFVGHRRGDIPNVHDVVLVVPLVSREHIVPLVASASVPLECAPLKPCEHSPLYR